MHAMLDSYNSILEPPKEPSKEFAAYDGGVDLVKMGLAPSSDQTRKAVKKKEEVRFDAQQEVLAESAKAISEVRGR